MENQFGQRSLNPCFSGTYSRRANNLVIIAIPVVLILVLVEHTLGVCPSQCNNKWQRVLILVLVEHTLGVVIFQTSPVTTPRLNPCFSGTYSRREPRQCTNFFKAVLILVLVEHTLGVLWQRGNQLMIPCLNPCFSGTYSRRICFLV